MQNEVAITNIRSIKSLYTTAKHFDDLLRNNGASYSERLDFAIKLYELNGVPIPEIHIQGEDAVETVRIFLENAIGYPITCKKAYPQYIEWCKEMGYVALQKKRFMSIVRELTTVKLSASLNGISYRNLIVCRPSDLIVDMEGKLCTSEQGQRQ